MAESNRWRWIVLVCLAAGTTGCELEPATPSDSIQLPWQFAIEFELEQHEEPEYIAHARLFDALDHTLDPVGNAGKSLRLSEGDDVYAEGVHLDVETRTQWANRESFDYSAAVPDDGQDYGFEFRRPDETIEATIPGPPAFEVVDVGEVEYSPASLQLEWTPIDDERWESDQHPVHDAQRKTVVNLSLEVLDDGCITLLDGDPVIPIAGASNLLDTGSYRFSAANYHSPDRDCTYDIIFERISVKRVPGTWTKDEVEAPTNGVTAFARQTVRKRFVALQR